MTSQLLRSSGLVMPEEGKTFQVLNLIFTEKVNGDETQDG